MDRRNVGNHDSMGNPGWNAPAPGWEDPAPVGPVPGPGPSWSAPNPSGGPPSPTGGPPSPAGADGPGIPVVIGSDESGGEICVARSISATVRKTDRLRSGSGTR